MDNGINVTRKILKEQIDTKAKEFYSRYDVEKHIDAHGKQSFDSLATEFWQNPNQNLSKLKEKYGVNASISVYDIVKTYSLDVYLDYLLDYYDADIEIDSIIEKYCVPFVKMQSLVFPVILKSEDLFCPKCLNSNEYILEVILNGKEKSYGYRCCNCESYFSDLSELIDKIEAEKRLKLKEKSKEEFKILAGFIEKALPDIKCGKCQGDLKLKAIDEENLKYEIICTECSAKYDTLDKAREEYEKWKKRAAMMIAIKKKEQEQIDKILLTKKPSEAIFKKENIIGPEEGKPPILYMFDIQKMGPMKAWQEMYKAIKGCTKISKIVLVNILELCKSGGETSTWNYTNGERLEVCAFKPEEEPVVVALRKKIDIIMLRPELRKLINKNLIAMDEEENYIHVMPILVQNMEAIKSLLKTQDISERLRYLIFERNNFTCTRCGETGRPLKIAYFTMDKNNHDLNLMTCLCEDCFDDTTENEIIIDGTYDFEFEKENEPAFWQFITGCFEELKNEESAFETLNDMAETYGQGNLIKALAATADKMQNKEIDSSVKALINYSKGILENSKGNKNVFIAKRVTEKYNIDEWLEKINK